MGQREQKLVKEAIDRIRGLWQQRAATRISERAVIDQQLWRHLQVIAEGSVPGQVPAHHLPLPADSCTTVELYQRSECNMMSAWAVRFLLTRRKSGAFTLKARTEELGEATHKWCSAPFRSASGFIAAVESVPGYDGACALTYDEIVEMLPKVAMLSPALADEAAIELAIAREDS